MAWRDGVSYAQGRVPPGGATLALAVAGLLALVLMGFMALALVLVAAGVTMAMGVIAQARVGGQSGDILGACQQCSEVALLMVLL
ncbi:MAG: adenosylcobinamide-GDP ribazoletransferase [Rhodobacteraceae bacterium]|nr:adenosylcobinamide-GDP ribazoletransferase [Paracoccaceae bacterium]